jgi:DHA3 family tetracycline resistance protein-like MFS transporter
MGQLSATSIYLLLAGASAAFLAMVGTVSALYRVQTVGLNPLQLVLVGTVLESAVFLCEVPTGVVADVYSRRLSVIIGLFIMGIGFIVEGTFPLFAAALASQMIWGMGYTFTSGATEAWIADEVGEQNVGRVYLQGTQVAQFGRLLGIVISVSLATFGLNLPILLAGVFFIGLASFLLFTMPEHGFQPLSVEERHSWRALGQTLQKGIQGSTAQSIAHHPPGYHCFLWHGQ